MKLELNYNIHNAVKFRIVTARSYHLTDLINLKFSFFEVERLENPDVVLNIGEFVPSNDDCYLVDHKWYIKDNYLFYEWAEGKGKWKVEIKGLDEGITEINFDGGITGFQGLINRDFIAQMLLLKVIEYKLARRGYILIHGSGVAKEGNGYIFVGRGGSFKSSICMNLVRKADFDFLGDDHVLIYEDKVLSFPTSLSVLDFMYQYLPDENAWTLLNKLSFTRYLWKKRMMPKSTTIRIGSPSKLERVFFIVRTDSSQVIERRLKLDEAVDKILLNNRLEDFIALSHMGIRSAPFLKQDLAYSFIFPSSNVASFPSFLKENLKKLLANLLPIYEVQIPKHYNCNTFKKVYEVLRRHGL